MPMHMAYFAGLVVGLVLLLAGLVLGSPKGGGRGAQVLGAALCLFGVIGTLATALDVPSGRRERLLVAAMAALLGALVVGVLPRPAPPSIDG